MVSIRDQNPRRFEFALNSGNLIRRFHRSQFIAYSQVVFEIEKRFARRDSFAQAIQLMVRARVEPENRAGVELASRQQLEPIFFRGGKSFLVRQDASLAELLELDARDEADAM